MFRGKGRVVFAVLVIVALAVPTVGVLASNAGATSSARPGAAAAPGASADLNWELVHQAPAGVKYYSIYFPTKAVGYATGGPDWNNDQNGRGAPITISKTVDGGKTWTSSTIAGTDGWARGLTCTDADNCWITGNNASNKVLRTTDGGKSWKPFTNVSGYSNWLWSAGWTKNGSTILAGTTCYDPEDAGAKANWLRSTDGQTFSGVLALPPPAGSPPGTPGTYMCYVQWDIDCPTPGVCYSAGRTYIWRSNNNGQTWAQTNAGVTRWYGLSCLNSTTCWVSGKNPWIKSTTNSGATWYGASVSAGGAHGVTSNGHFWDIWMFNELSGYAVGCSDMATDNSDRCLGQGVIYKTTDGMNWGAINPPVNSDGKPVADLMDVWAFNEGDVYVVEFSGKIWHGTTAPQATSTPTATSTPISGSINGIAFADTNGDGFRDEGEPGVAGATILLRKGRKEIATAVSGTDGAFQFTGVEAGQVTLEERTSPTGFATSRFYGTFVIQANRELTLYVGHDAIKETETPTPTATETPTETPTITPTVSITPAPTATATATATATRATSPGYLPLITQ